MEKVEIDCQGLPSARATGQWRRMTVDFNFLGVMGLCIKLDSFG